MDEKTLQGLIAKYLSGTASDAERKLLMDWYRAVDLSELELPFADKNGADETGSRMLAQINTRINLAAPAKPTSNVRTMVRVAAAAVIILVAGALWLTLKTNPAKQEMATIQHTGTDALPGFESAVLTTSDGKKIVLDSTADGTLQTESSVSVQLKSGKLSYSNAQKQAAVSLYNTMATPKGRQYQLELADGTKVWLNAASSIRYPVAFNEATRTVEITGEAYFEVVHDASKPFHVIDQRTGINVRVLGTHFNVNTYEDELAAKVTLIEGSVEVSAKNEKKKIVPGQQVTYEPGKKQLNIAVVETSGVTAWKDGRFSFKNADIKTVMRQLARWYDMEIIYESEPPSDRFGGTISRKSNLSEVLRILSVTGVNYRIDKNRLYISR